MNYLVKRILVGLAGSSILAAGVAAFAEGEHHGGWDMTKAGAEQMHERMLERAGKQLDLDDAQKARLATLASRLDGVRIALRGEGGGPREQLQTLFAGPTFDRNQATSMLDEKTAVLRAKSPEVIAAAADFFDNLRPDQQQQVRDFMNKRGGRRFGPRS